MKISLAISIIFACAFGTGALAKNWRAEQVLPPGTIKISRDMPALVKCGKKLCHNDMSAPFAETRRRAPNGLPDGHVASGQAKSGINSAWYEKPTRRYDHGILGDGLEAARLAVKTTTGKTIRFSLPKSQVFEDVTPRLADINGDGNLDVITILSSVSKGGSIAVFTLEKNKLALLAQAPFIGRSNRWLNIAGIEDFTKNGRLEIAAVRTPHIGGTLQFWTIFEQKLVVVDQMRGFSNHFIGSNEQRLSAIGDFDQNGTLDIATPSANRKSLRLVGFVKEKLKTLGDIPLPKRIDKAIAVTGKGKNIVLTVGLEDGAVYAIH